MNSPLNYQFVDSLSSYHTNYMEGAVHEEGVVGLVQHILKVPPTTEIREII